jgi:multisubunit Na+/H+ antiporter MnhC subunit
VWVTAEAMSKKTWPALTVFLIACFPLAFSGELIFEVIHDQFFRDVPWLRNLQLAIIDTVLLLIILSSTIRLWSRSDWPKVSIWAWWIVGAGLTLALDVITGDGRASNAWVDLAAEFGYVVSLAIILAATVKMDPTRVVRLRTQNDNRAAWKDFRGALPLLIGTFAAYIGSTIWNSVLESRAQRSNCVMECRGAVALEYFAQLSQVIPLLLVAVGIEAGLFRTSLKDPVPRAMTITTVIILCVAEALAISTLTSLNRGEPSDILSEWHEYLAFIVTWEACFIALSLLVWVLIFRSVEEDRQG